MSETAADASGAPGQIVIRAATTADVTQIRRLVAPYVQERLLVSKEAVAYYEGIQQFRVALLDGRVVGCGALHVFWEDIAEIRTLAVDPAMTGRGIGGLIVDALIEDARRLGVERIFCLTFMVDFFVAHGFQELQGDPVSPDVFVELLRSFDEGTAELLDLERVKPNTLGNTRMLLDLTRP